LERVRARKPLVQNVTNFVVMNSTANALLAIGASPAMVHAPEGSRASSGSAGRRLVVNIGTLSPEFVAGMRARSPERAPTDPVDARPGSASAPRLPHAGGGRAGPRSAPR
jgi:hydroxyethylthiazole kinase